MGTVGDGSGAAARIAPSADVDERAAVGAGTTVWDLALVAGVPARRIKWAGRTGEPLHPAGEGHWHCPRYCQTDGALVRL